jgi:predicted CoA-binding protein
MSKNTLGEVLGKYRVIAVVGLSSDPAKPSYGVASYMKEHGYRIVPVNPFVEEVLGEKSYKSLLEMPVEIQQTIEIVDIFRRAQDVPPIVEQAVKLKRAFGKPYVVWMQLGIVNQEAAQAAVQAGLTVVMDRCIMVEHERLSQAQNQRSNRS